MARRRGPSVLVWYFSALAVLLVVGSAVMWNVWTECLGVHSFWFCAVALGGR